MSQERLSKQTLFAKNRKRLGERPRTKWFDYIKNLVWNRFGFRPSEMQSALVDQEV